MWSLLPLVVEKPPANNVRVFILECVRRDPLLPMQTYAVVQQLLLDFPVDRQRILSLSIAQFGGNGIEHKIYSKKYSGQHFLTASIGLDEITSKLFISLQNLPKKSILFIEFGLKFDKPDQTGFRRIVHVDPKPKKYTIDFTSIPQDCKGPRSTMYENLIFSPKDGTMVCSMFVQPPFFSHREEHAVYRLCWMKPYQQTLKMSFGPSFQLPRLPGNSLFCKNGSILICWYRPLKSPEVAYFLLRPNIRVEVPKEFEGTLYFDFYNCTYDPDFQPELSRRFKPDPWEFIDLIMNAARFRELVKDDLVLWSPSPGWISKLKLDLATERNLLLLGRSHKYSIFDFRGTSMLGDRIETLVLVKSFEKVVKKGKPIRTVLWNPETDPGVQRLFDNLPPGISKNRGLQLCYRRVNNNHLLLFYQASGGQGISTWFNLGDKFRDYRTCANCQEVETTKRRNVNRKRIADFKVCRLCKAKNFHRRFWQYACHYCSLECMKIHWNKHKIVHRKPKIYP